MASDVLRKGPCVWLSGLLLNQTIGSKNALADLEDSDEFPWV